MKKSFLNMLKILVVLSLVFSVSSALAVSVNNPVNPRPAPPASAPDSASLGYIPLVKIPGLLEEGKTNFEDFLPMLFTFTLGLAGVLAVIAISIGGFQYATTDAISGKTEGKTRIKNALTGLALVLSAWIILNTINPELLDLSLVITPITIEDKSNPPEDSAPANSTGRGSYGERCTEVGAPLDNNLNVCPPDPPAYTGPGLSHEQAMESLGPRFTTNRGCSDRLVGTCTSLDSIPEGAIDALKSIGEECGCNVKITGGTEVGHGSHGVGKSVVDLVYSRELIAAIDKDYKINANFGRGATCEPPGKAGSTMTCGAGTGHIHMEL